MIEIKCVKSIKEIDGQRKEYMNNLPFSQEFYVEDMVKNSSYYQIYLNNNLLGYFCVNSEKVLSEFYINNMETVQAQYIFKILLERDYFTAAEVKSFDYLLMSLCLDFKKNSSCVGYSFRDFNAIEIQLSAYEDLRFEVAKQVDMVNIAEISGDFFKVLESNIYNQEVFALYSKNQLLGAGICQKIFKDLLYYDIGMVVAEEHRNKGVGTYIISELKKHCISRHITPVCGCSYFNYASKKTLERAGFITNHRLVRFEF